MLKRFFYFLLLLSVPRFAFGGIGGNIDDREVVGWIESRPSYVDSKTENKWNTEQYNNIVLVDGKDIGTGSFISPKHILTTTHVAKGCGIDNITECKLNKSQFTQLNSKLCTITTSDGKKLNAKVVRFGGNNCVSSITADKDWSILEITDKNFCSKHWFRYKLSTAAPQYKLWRAGFGDLRKLNPKDIKLIKDVYEATLRILYGEVINNGGRGLEKKFQDYIASLSPEDKRQIIQDLVNQDVANGVNLKDSPKKNIGGKDVVQAFYKFYPILTGETDSKGKIIKKGKTFAEDYLNDYKTLKVIKDCSISKVNDGVGYHNCQSWSGDSGSSIQNNVNNIVLLHKAGEKYITSKDSYINIGPDNKNIFGNDDVVKLLDAAQNICKSAKH